MAKKKSKKPAKPLPAKARRALEDSVVVSLHLDPGYYKAGDDWQQILDEHDGDVRAALKTWADRLEESAGALRALSKGLEEAGHLDGCGMAHDAEIVGVPASLASKLHKSPVAAKALLAPSRLGR